MSGHRPWREVKAEKARRDAERGHVPLRDPDRFIHTRGPHEGQLNDGEHVCVPECYEDTSHVMDEGRWVDPRPEYRVIADPWYDHDVGDDGHDASACAAGYSLEIYIRNPDQLGVLGAWRSIGATQTSSGGTLDLREVHALVIDYVTLLALPHRAGITADRITVYAPVG